MASLPRGKVRRSRRAAIEAKCRDCIYDPQARGTWRQQVTLCSCFDCPLWQFRPRSYRPVPERVRRYYNVDDSQQTCEKQQTAVSSTIDRLLRLGMASLIDGFLKTSKPSAKQGLFRQEQRRNTA